MRRESRIRRRGATGGGGGGTDSFATPGDWHYIGETGEPAFENSFTAFSSISPGYSKAGFRKVGDYLEIVGLYIGSASTTMFTLPVGFRPSVNLTMFGVAVDLASGGVINRFDGISVQTDGSVISGANAASYSPVLWSIPPGVFLALTPPELSV